MPNAKSIAKWRRTIEYEMAMLQRAHVELKRYHQVRALRVGDQGGLNASLEVFLVQHFRCLMEFFYFERTPRTPTYVRPIRARDLLSPKRADAWRATHPRPAGWMEHQKREANKYLAHPSKLRRTGKRKKNWRWRMIHNRITRLWADFQKLGPRGGPLTPPSLAPRLLLQRLDGTPLTPA